MWSRIVSKKFGIFANIPACVSYSYLREKVGKNQNQISCENLISYSLQVMISW